MYLNHPGIKLPQIDPENAFVILFCSYIHDFAVIVENFTYKLLCLEVSGVSQRSYLDDKYKLKAEKYTHTLARAIHQNNITYMDN